MDYYQSSDNNTYDNPNRPGGFAVASMVCGVLSLAVCCCTGFLSVIPGGLGILFAVLTKRSGRKMHPMCNAGICLSVIGIILGILMTVFSFYVTFNNPLYMEQLDMVYQQIYGVGFEEFWNTYY